MWVHFLFQPTKHPLVSSYLNLQIHLLFSLQFLIYQKLDVLYSLFRFINQIPSYCLPDLEFCCYQEDQNISYLFTGLFRWNLWRIISIIKSLPRFIDLLFKFWNLRIDFWKSQEVHAIMRKSSPHLLMCDGKLEFFV